MLVLSCLLLKIDRLLEKCLLISGQCLVPTSPPLYSWESCHVRGKFDQSFSKFNYWWWKWTHPAGAVKLRVNRWCVFFSWILIFLWTRTTIACNHWKCKWYIHNRLPIDVIIFTAFEFGNFWFNFEIVIKWEWHYMRQVFIFIFLFLYSCSSYSYS